MCRASIVRARIDERTKKKAAAVLEAIGLTVSDALRLMMVRIARDKALPFERPVNSETIEAMKEARRGGLKRYPTANALLRSLNPNIEADGRTLSGQTGTA